LQAEADKLKAEAEALKRGSQAGGSHCMEDGGGEKHQKGIRRVCLLDDLLGLEERCAMSILGAAGSYYARKRHRRPGI